MRISSNRNIWEASNSHSNYEPWVSKKGGIMISKTIVALACLLIASPAFAQTTTRLTTVEGVTVTAPVLSAQEGTAATYQPPGTLVIRTDNANPERFDSFAPGVVFDKLGRPFRGSIQPGARVAVFYANDGYTRLVDHIVVLD
jgi:hypothetical protein